MLNKGSDGGGCKMCKSSIIEMGGSVSATSRTSYFLVVVSLSDREGG
jgi:hypothetical protein